MSTITLNIGLDADASLLDADVVCEFIASQVNGVGFSGATVESFTEPTLVVEFATAELDAAPVSVINLADAICHQFNQECVAVYSTGIRAGVLIGPNATNWGPFDASQFFMLDGRALVAHIIDEAQAEVIH